MDDYDVGFGKPPKQYQFKKGVCPNPAGRGKKRRSDIGERTREALSETVLIDRRGRSIRMSKLEAFIQQTVLSAAKGDINNAALILHFLDTAERHGDIGDLIIRVEGSLL